MKTNKLLSVFAILVLLLAAMPMLSAGAAPAAKVDVCHREGNGSFHLINVSENALSAHLAHGDALPGDPVPGMEGKKFDEACNIVDAGPTVTPGYSGLTEAAGVRYRGNSSGNEIYLGIPDLGVGSNRVEASYPNVYANWQDGTYAVTFSFDQAANKIVTTIDGPGGTESLEYDFDDLLAPGCPTANWNTMDINVVDRLTTGELAFNNVMLNGFSLGNFDDEGWKNWTVSGFDFSQNFTVSGDMVVQGWTGSETNKLQIVVGCLP
jgi:hypothetical protein